MELVSEIGKYFQVNVYDALDNKKEDISFFRFQVNIIVYLLEKELKAKI